MPQYLMNVLIALDQLGNAVTGGDPDETISSRVGKQASLGGWWALRAEWVIDLIFGQGHCRRNIENDEGADNLF